MIPTARQILHIPSHYRVAGGWLRWEDGKGSLGVNLEPCGVIPGVQNGMRVTSVDPSGASAITGVQVGDMIWGADNEGFSEVSAPK